MSGIVEVKDTEQHCYYRAKLLDIKQDQCLVQYEDLEGGAQRQAQSSGFNNIKYWY